VYTATPSRQIPPPFGDLCCPPAEDIATINIATGCPVSQGIANSFADGPCVAVTSPSVPYDRHTAPPCPSRHLGPILNDVAGHRQDMDIQNVSFVSILPAILPNHLPYIVSLASESIDLASAFLHPSGLERSTVTPHAHVMFISYFILQHLCS
jgi:hypothetical protein